MSRRSNPVEELVRRTAHRETFHNVAHQLQCLKRRYNVLYGVTTDTSSSYQNQVSPQQQQQPNSRAFILRKLKYALRKQYEACFPLPPPDRCSVLLLFDTNEEAFFEIRLKPKAWPEDWPTRFDCGSTGIDVELYSLAIYMKVLEAFNEEEEEAENGTTGGDFSEPSRAFGVVSSSGRTGDSTGIRGPRSSVVEENGLTRVIVKSEEEEIVIGDEEEEEEENNIHSNEQVNEQQVNRRASADGLFINGDQQQQQQEEDGMDYNNTLQRENLTERPREESSRRPSSSTANNSHNNNDSNGSNNNNNDNSNGSSSSQLPFSNTVSVKQEPTANSSSLIITRMRPLESTFSSESLQNHPLSLPPSAPVASAFSSHLLNSSRSSSEMRMIAAANRFYASSSYLTTCSYDRLSCPLCKKLLQKYNLRDHINVVHLKRRRYHCAWPGCAEAFGYFSNSRSHLRRVHRSTLYERYLQCRD